jgi:MFS transporter, OFA family, oxalate/formate antiporter
VGNPKIQPGAPVKGLSLKEAVMTRQYVLVFIMVFWFGFFGDAFTVHIVPDAINSGMASTAAAYILTTSGALMLLGRIFLGLAADSLGNKQIIIFGGTLSTIGLLLISSTRAHWAFFVCAAFMGLSQGGIGTSLSPLVAGLFGLKSHGLIFGSIGLGYTLGSSVGPYLTGYLFDVTGNFQTALLLCAAASVLALVFASLIKTVRSS